PRRFRERVEARLGRPLLDGSAPAAPAAEADHAGVHAQRQDGLAYAGFPVYLGLMNGEQMLKLADLAAEVSDREGGREGGHGRQDQVEIRLTRRENFILANLPAERVQEVVRRVAVSGVPPCTRHPRRRGGAP